MYKLVGHSLTRGEWFEPESQSLILTERNSTSTITLGPEAPAVGFDEWLLDESPGGDRIVWRVKSLGDTFNTETRSIELEHVIQTLDDISLFEHSGEEEEEEEPEDLPAYQAVLYLLSRQSVWQLGDFQFSVTNPYDFQKETLLDALENVTETLDDAVWEYDLTTFPFTLHIRQRNTAVTSEMRGGRNLSTMRRTISRSGMFTRFYPVGKQDLRLPGEYVSQNESLYGRVDKVETDQSKATVESLQAWAEGRLRRHCEPEVVIQIGGLELSAETGEPLDKLTLNRVCRCPLPEFGTTIAEKITKLQWRDTKKEPENVQVTLCNNTQDVATIIRQEKRRGSGGSGGAGQAKQNYLFEVNGEHLLYEVFDECGHFHGVLRMTSESLRVAFDNLISSTRSEFLLTAESLRIAFENEMQSTRSEFMMTSESLRIQFENDLASTRSEFELTAQSLRIDFTDADASLRSSIQAEAGRIGLLVSGYGTNAEVIRASIVAAINREEGTSQVVIDADQIDLSGYVTMTAFNAVKGHVDNLTGQTIVESFCRASLVVGTTVTANTTFVHDGDTIYKRAMKWTSGGGTIATVHATGDTTSIILNHSHEMTVDSDGVVTVGDAQTTEGTFNIADTAFYQARVASAWNSGGMTAKADQTSQYAPYGGSVVIKIQYVNAAGTTVDTGRSVTIWNTDCSHTFDDNRTFSANGTYYASTYGYSGFSKVIVSVNTDTEEKSITSNGTYTPSSGKIGFSKVVVNVSCGHTFDNNRTFSANGTYYASTYGYSGFSKVVVSVSCGHTFTTKSISSNGTFSASSDGYSGYSSVTVSGVRTSQHNNCAESLTKYGTQALMYVPDTSGITLSTKVRNVSAAGRCWYYGSNQTLFTAYT